MGGLKLDILKFENVEKTPKFISNKTPNRLPSINVITELGNFKSEPHYESKNK